VLSLAACVAHSGPDPLDNEGALELGHCADEDVASSTGTPMTIISTLAMIFLVLVTDLRGFHQDLYVSAKNGWHVFRAAKG
jgi:hypothetical protein